MLLLLRIAAAISLVTSTVAALVAIAFLAAAGLVLVEELFGKFADEFHCDFCRSKI